MSILSKDEVIDGIISTRQFGYYTLSGLKILWILKEANDPKGGGWDLRKFLGERDKYLFQYKSKKSGVALWPRTWGLVIKVSWGLLNGLCKFEQIPKDIKNAADILDYIAVININKNPGSKRASCKRIKKSFLDPKNQKFLLQQIKEIKPNIIIGGNTLWLFYKNNVLLSNSDFNGKNWGTFKDGILWIDAYHPNQTKITHEEYYRNVLNVINTNKPII